MRVGEDEDACFDCFASLRGGGRGGGVGVSFWRLGSEEETLRFWSAWLFDGRHFRCSRLDFRSGDYGVVRGHVVFCCQTG